MTKTKILIGLTTMLSLLVILAAPALASWESNNGASKGSSQLKEGTNAVFQTSAESHEIICPTLNDEWALHGDQSKLAVLAKLEKCTVESGGVKTSVVVTECEMQLEQEKGTFTAVTNIVAPCEFVINLKPAACTFVLASQGNHKLKSTTLTNVGKNVEVAASLEKVIVEYPEATLLNPENRKTCREFLGVSGSTGLFKATSIEHELKAI